MVTVTPKARPSGAGRRRQAAFSIIELMVVLAAIAVLLTLAVPQYQARVDRGREAVLRENLEGMREAIDRFHEDNEQYPESLAELVDRRYLQTVPIDPMTGSAETWQTLPPPAGARGGVYDVRSGAEGAGPSGLAFSEL